LEVSAFQFFVEGGGEDAELIGKHLDLFSLVDFENRAQVSQMVGVDCLEKLIILS
jgi:hypothetical protein